MPLFNFSLEEVTLSIIALDYLSVKDTVRISQTSQIDATAWRSAVVIDAATVAARYVVIRLNQTLQFRESHRLRTKKHFHRKQKLTVLTDTKLPLLAVLGRSRSG